MSQNVSNLHPYSTSCFFNIILSNQTAQIFLRENGILRFKGENHTTNSQNWKHSFVVFVKGGKVNKFPCNCLKICKMFVGTVPNLFQASKFAFGAIWVVFYDETSSLKNHNCTPGTKRYTLLNTRIFSDIRSAFTTFGEWLNKSMPTKASLPLDWVLSHRLQNKFFQNFDF